MVDKVNWKWTKTIKRQADSKVYRPPKQILDVVGPAPFSAAQWQKWSGPDKMNFPLKGYTAAKINVELNKLSEGFSTPLTSTSLRDHYHRALGEMLDYDAEKMLRFTPHKDAKALQSSYAEARIITSKVSTKKPAVKQDPKKQPSKVAKLTARKSR